jgi:hypothetical protein
MRDVFGKIGHHLIERVADVGCSALNNPYLGDRSRRRPSSFPLQPKLDQPADSSSGPLILLGDPVVDGQTILLANLDRLSAATQHHTNQERNRHRLQWRFLGPVRQAVKWRARRWPASIASPMRWVVALTVSVAIWIAFLASSLPQCAAVRLRRSCQSSVRTRGRVSGQPPLVRFIG